jgi:hypothetical protein
MPVKLKSVFGVIILSILVCSPVAGFSPNTVGASARQGFEQILELWRSQDYYGLYARLEHPREEGWEYFAQRIVYASRMPACCWEQLQDVKVTVIDQDRVTINARVGFEVEGVGTRFVMRDFHLRRIGGIWKLPMRLILDLSDYNFQRIPREIYERHL